MKGINNIAKIITKIVEVFHWVGVGIMAYDDFFLVWNWGGNHFGTYSNGISQYASDF